MLELRPSCEACGKSLPPDAGDAMICSYECTFCRHCVDTVLMNVCPNCGGGLTLRPVRPKARLAKHPASTKVVSKAVDARAHAEFAATIKDIPPGQR